MILEQGAPIFDRIFSGVLCQLIDEALHHERGVAVADGAPPQNRDAGYSRNNLAFLIEFGDARKNYELIKRELLNSGAATAVAQTSAPITESWGDSWGFTWPT